ncbi:MAG: hypothetical protein V1822_04565 [Candidatus Micrarchaeota archaeon]
MVGAQRKKSKVHSASSRSSSTYFRQKATHAKAAKKEQKRTLRAARSSSKKIAKRARASISRARHASIKKSTGTTRLHSMRAAAQEKMRSSTISRYFLSSDIAREKVPSVALVQKEAFEKKLEVAKALNTGLAAGKKRTRLSRFEVMRRNVMILVRRLLSWFSVRSQKLNMTAAGRRALAQLEDLYDLLTLEAIDDEALLRLKVAYGEACYYVTQASRGYSKRNHKKENYGPYFDRFVDTASG